MKAWIGLGDKMTSEWSGKVTVKDWWAGIALKRSPNRKAMTSLLMLISWEVWKERNARVIRNTAAPTMIIVDKIEEEAKLWVVAALQMLWAWVMYCLMSNCFVSPLCGYCLEPRSSLINEMANLCLI